MRVLIVDDELWVTEVIKNVIDWAQEGFDQVETVNDGIDALELVLRENPELVLTDIRMPGISGLDMIKKARESGKSTNFIIISGHNDFEYAKDAIEYGASGYLLKPIDSKELLEIVGKVKKSIRLHQKMQLEKQAMKKALSKSIGQLKAQYFFDYFHGKAPAKELEVLNHDYALAFQPGKYITGIIAVDQDKLSAKEVNKKIYTSFLELKPNTMTHDFVLLPYRNQMVSILNYPQSERGRLMEMFTVLPERLREHLPEQINITIALGIEADSFEDLPKSYRQARIRIRSRAVCGLNTIYAMPALGQALEEYALPAEQELRFRSKLELDDANSAHQFADQTVDRLIQASEAYPSALVDGIQSLIAIARESCEGTIPLEQSHAEYFDRAEGNAEEYGSPAQLRGLFHELIDYVFSLKVLLRKSKNQKIAEVVKDYIGQNYAKDISLSDAAAVAYISANYLSEIFSKETGTTFKEYLTSVRLDVAKSLLKDLQYRVSDISAIVGYDNARHFSKQFKKYVGVSPADYRKLVLK